MSKRELVSAEEAALALKIYGWDEPPQDRRRLDYAYTVATEPERVQAAVQDARQMLDEAYKALTEVRRLADQMSNYGMLWENGQPPAEVEAVRKWGSKIETLMHTDGCKDPYGDCCSVGLATEPPF